MLSRSLVSGSVIVALLAMAACGSAAAPKTATSSSSASPATSTSTATSTAACASGAAGSDSLITVAQQSPSTVDTLTGTCWSSIAPTPIVTSVIGTAPAGVSGWTKVAWSPTDLYVLASVKQWPLVASAASLWNGQTVEFYVSGDNTKGGALGPKSAQYGIMAGSNVVHTGTRGFTTPPTGMSAIIANKGYDAELIVPWSSMGVSAPAAGQLYKFDVAIDYTTTTTTQVAQTMWVGTQNNYQSTVAWGSIKLG